MPPAPSLRMTRYLPSKSVLMMFVITAYTG
jgi:hypothetical protein